MGTPIPTRIPSDDHVVLLATDGTPLGTAPRSRVHTPNTPLHLAFSCYLFDSAGQVLLTRRALSKQTWPGVWTNSFCGHPRWGERPVDAVARRGLTELGVRPERIRCVLPDFRYRAVDDSGVEENEVCPVFIGWLPNDARLNLDPDECAAYQWVSWPQLSAAVAAVPALVSPWAALQVPLLTDVLDQIATRTPSGAKP